MKSAKVKVPDENNGDCASVEETTRLGLVELSGEHVVFVMRDRGESEKGDSECVGMEKGGGRGSTRIWLGDGVNEKGGGMEKSVIRTSLPVE